MGYLRLEAAVDKQEEAVWGPSRLQAEPTGRAEVSFGDSYALQGASISLRI